MELLPILRLAWRRRFALGLGVVLALALGVLSARGAATRQGIASTRLVLDTPVSQLVDAAPKGAETLGWRTELLAELMTTRPARLQISHEARVSMQQLVVVNPTLNTPVLPTTLPRRAASVAVSSSAQSVLTVLADPTLPMVSLEASAPSRDAAARLAAAGASALRTVAAVPPDSPRTQPIVVQDAGSIRASDVASGAGKKQAAAVCMAVFLLWSAMVLVVPGALTRARRSVHRARLA
jgi:hypothetical protein